MSFPGGSIEAATAVHPASRGCSTYFSSTAKAIANASAGPCNLYALEVAQPNTAQAWLQIFDLAAASVTLGTTVPKISLFIPAGTASVSGAMDKQWVVPISFATRMSYALTTTATGATGITTAGDINIFFIE